MAIQSVDISVVIPVYNEEVQIPIVLKEIIQVLSDTAYTFEVVPVDDGSHDNSVLVIEGVAAEYPGIVRLQRHPYNKGNGATVRTGIRYARGEVVVCMDGDGQHDPAFIPQLLDFFPDYDMVVGARDDTYQGSWHRNLANGFYNWLSSWVTNFGIKDLTSGFRAFRRQVVRPYLPLFPQGFSYPATTTLLLLRAGYNVTFMPIHARPRQSGKSKIRLWRDGVNFMVIILRIMLLYNPLQIFFRLSLVMGILGGISMMFGVIERGDLFIPNSAVFLFVTAILIFSIGLLASQIADVKVLVSEYRTSDLNGDESKPA